MHIRSQVDLNAKEIIALVARYSKPSSCTNMQEALVFPSPHTRKVAILIKQTTLQMN